MKEGKPVMCAPDSLIFREPILNRPSGRRKSVSKVFMLDVVKPLGG